MEPAIKYAKTSDGVNIAYYTLGQATPLGYRAAGGHRSHLTQEWRYPEQCAWLKRLANRDATNGTSVSVADPLRALLFDQIPL